jgi:hypothetical protein
MTVETASLEGRRTFPVVSPRELALPAMAAALALYALLHSSLRNSFAALLHMDSRGCYFCLSATTWTGLIDPLAALVLVGSALLAAWALARQFDAGHYEQTLAIGLLALAFVAIPASGIGAVGDSLHLGLLRLPAGPLLAAVPSFAVIFLQGLADWHPNIHSIVIARPQPLPALVWAFALTLIAALAIITLTHPATGIDALGYHAPLAVFLWQDGNLGAFLDRAPGIWALAHPGTAELWFGLLRLLGGEALADLGQLPFAFLGSAAVAAFARRLGLSRGAALLAAGSYLLVPMLVLQSGTQANDVVGAGLLMATMALASAPLREWSFKRLALIGLGLGLVATTKLALLPGVAGVGLFVVGGMVWRVKSRDGLRRLGVGLLVLGGVIGMVVAPWWGRNVMRFGNPLYPAALPLIGRGFTINNGLMADAAFVPSLKAWPLYPLLEAHDEQSGFGMLFAVGVPLGLIAALFHARRQPLVLYGIVSLLTLPAWWLLTQHFPRFLLGLAGLGFAFLPFVMLGVPRNQRRATALLILAAALFSAIVTLDQGILPFAAEPSDRTQFYSRVWGVDSVASSLAENEGIFYNTGFALSFAEYAGYYPLLGPALSRVVIPGEGRLSTEAVVARMKGAGVRYAYVAASPDNRARVEAEYSLAKFDLADRSLIMPDETTVSRHQLYRPASDYEQSTAIVLYLYRLK